MIETTIKETTLKAVPSKIEPSGIIKELVNKETKDLYLAASFHCEGCKFLDIDKTDRTRMVFVFEGGELADRVERQWYQGILVVSATIYAASLRTMKSLIHS